MIQLNILAAQLNLITGGPQVITATASYVDAGPANAYNPASAPNLTVAAAGTVPLVTGPAATFERNVNKITIRNTDASVTCPVEVENFDGTLGVPEVKCALPAGWGLYYEGAGAGWYVMSPDGGRLGLQGIQGNPGTNGTNGTNAGNIGTAVVDFGAFPGSNTASVVVTGQTTILSASAVEAFLMTDATTDHTASDHRYAAALIFFACGTIVPGIGFTINATCLDNMQGTFNVRFVWN